MLRHAARWRTEALKSIPRNDRRRRPSAPPPPLSRTQSFTCSADLLRAFEHRAFALGCSFDWLLEEAMQRLLAESAEVDGNAAANDAPMPLPAESAYQLRPPPPSSLPLPAPPDTSPSTLPPPFRAPHKTPKAAPPAKARPRTAAEEPLVLYYGDEQLVLDRHPYVIGRSPILADLVIESGEVSRRHALIEHTTDGWVIRDLGSTNGIIVNGEVVRSAGLRAGVVLSIGPLAFGVAAPG